MEFQTLSKRNNIKYRNLICIFYKNKTYYLNIPNYRDELILMNATTTNNNKKTKSKSWIRKKIIAVTTIT